MRDTFDKNGQKDFAKHSQNMAMAKHPRIRETVAKHGQHSKTTGKKTQKAIKTNRKPIVGCLDTQGVDL